MKRMTKLGLVVCLMLPAAVFADYGSLTENSNTSLLGFLKTIQGWLLGFAGSIALLFIVYGGFQYVTSAGNKQSIETAKKTLTYAIMGLILIILADLIFHVLTGGILTSIFGNKTL